MQYIVLLLSLCLLQSLTFLPSKHHSIAQFNQKKRPDLASIWRPSSIVEKASALLNLKSNKNTLKKHCAVEGNGSVPVYLNVYDITPINGYAYWLGLGAFHSGVQVHGVEYAFGAHEYPTTGIFEGEPKQSEGFTFRKGILIGWTEMTSIEVRKVMEELAEEYKGNAYNLITKNCNHFCNVACIKLTKNPIPSWVNRLARIGLLCNCVIPTSICTAKISHHSTNKTEEKVAEDEKKLCKNRSRRSNPSSNSSFSSSASSSSPCEPANRRRRAVTPTSPLMMASPPSSTATA